METRSKISPSYLAMRDYQEDATNHNPYKEGTSEYYEYEQSFDYRVLEEENHD